MSSSPCEDQCKCVVVGQGCTAHFSFIRVEGSFLRFALAYPNWISGELSHLLSIFLATSYFFAMTSAATLFAMLSLRMNERRRKSMGSVTKKREDAED